MGIPLATAERLAPLEGRAPTITTLCSHSSLQIFHGARKEGFRTIGLTAGPPARFYDAFPLARPDRFLSVPKMSDLPSVAGELRSEGAVIIPHGSFVEYMGADAFSAWDVPVYGNRKVIGWEADREKSREWLESAGATMPRRYENAAEVDGPVIVKYYGAKGGKGFYLAKNREALADFQSDRPPRDPGVRARDAVLRALLLLAALGPRLPGGARLAGAPRDGPAGRGEHRRAVQARQRRRSCSEDGDPPDLRGDRATFGVVLRESLLPRAFDVGARIVERSIELFGGMVGPFCVEGIMTEELEFKVFEISTRIVAGTNLFVSGSAPTRT
jgi:5-formaminoimidazole-4-carboxamide-1-(beta)-D-ribofuranosyl 5'-monophosphate synthetase